MMMSKEFLLSGKKARKQFIRDLINQGESDRAFSYYCINALLNNLKTAEKAVRGVNFEWLYNANVMLRSLNDTENKDLINPKLIDENLDISIATDVNYPDISTWGTFKQIPIGINPTQLLRDKFKSEFGVDAEFLKTVIEFKMGNVCFVPKLISVQY